MNEDLMEKLLNDFSGTLNEFNELVRKNDFDGVKRFLEEVNKLIQERSGIVLDDREPQYDHVLHELLDKMTGIVEKETTIKGIGGVTGTRYYTNKQVEEMIAEAEEQLKEITRLMNTYKDVNDAAYAQARSERSELIAKIASLKAALVEGQEFSTLTFIDPILAELQEERERLLREKEENLREIERLRAEERPEIPGNSVDQERLNQINSRMSELEGIFSDLEGQIDAIRATTISELIGNLRAETANISELEARKVEAQERLRATGDRIRETRGFDDVNAQARADYNELVQQISELDSEINKTRQNEENIEFLESLITEEVEQTENVLEPNDYTYMGRLSDEQIIRRLLSEQLHLSEEEINATIGEYSLMLADDGAHDEFGEDNPISLRRLVRTRKVKSDLTIGEVLDSLEAQLYEDSLVDNTQEIAEIDARIEELDRVINESEARIEEINSMQISEFIPQRQSNDNQIAELETRRTALQERLRVVGDRVRETRGFDDVNAQAHADYNELVQQIAEIDSQINEINNNNPIAELEARRTALQERLRVVGDRVRETRGFDDVNAQAHADYNELVQQISELDSEINRERQKEELSATVFQGIDPQLTVREALDGLEQEISELEARRTELQERLRIVGDRVRETRGFDDVNAQAHADYNELVQQISEIETLINSTRERQNRIKEVTGRKSEEERIVSAKTEKEELLNRRNNLEQETVRTEKPEIRNKINRLKEITGISVLERQLQQYREEYERLQAERDSLVGTHGKPGIDNSEKIAALEARNKEIDARIAEIDKQISGISGIVPPRKETERLDVAEEAHKIGDNIFKTAAIRRELASRNISRDDFLAFYQAGLDKTNEQIDQLARDSEKLKQELSTVLNNPDNPNKRLNERINEEEAKEEKDTESLINLYEQLRKNFITAGREEHLKEAGLDHEITTIEDAEKMKLFYKEYKQSVLEGYQSIKSSIGELKENALIFSQEIKKIKLEKATLELTGDSIEELKRKKEERVAFRAKLLEASITPEKDLTDEQRELLDLWQKTSERFLSEKTTRKFVYIDKNGEQKSIDVDSINDSYPGYGKDVELLGIPAYKDNLEQISAWNQTKDPYVFGEEVAQAYEAAEEAEKGAGERYLAKVIADKQKYVETFNGIPNPHKVKYENWKTAGSTLKGMKPVSRDLPMQTRTKNAIENVFRFLGIRAPKFTRIDEHGKEVRDIAGGLGTLAVDGLVIGAVTATAITAGPAVAAIGYAAKGIVTVGNRIAARIEYARHKDEIDSAKPVLNQADRNAREVARKAYYRSKGDNRLVAWAKAKSDKYFTRKREKETEKAIVAELVENYALSEEERTDGLIENLQIAKANQEARLRNQAQVAMGATTYNDIVGDPDSVNLDTATASLARNAVLQANRPNSRIENVNPNSTVARRDQYVKDEQPLERTSDLSEEAVQTVAAPVSAITAEQIYTGRKQKVDRWNRVLTAITAAGLNFGYAAWKNGFFKEEIIHHDAEVRDDVIHHDAIVEEEIVRHPAEYAEVEVPDYQTQFDTNRTLEELIDNSAGKVMNEYYSVSGGLKGQRAEALVDREITAAWFDNNTPWGTGISDAQGLSAPTITDRLADSGLLDANGLLRQDITVQDLLDATGCSNPDLTTLDGIYVSVGDKYWVSLSDLMKGMTKEVQIGTHIEQQLVKDAWDETVQNIVKPAWDETVETVVKPAWDETVRSFVPGEMIKAAGKGVAIGAGMAAADALHEAMQTTYIDGATPGRPEEVTPQATDTFDEIAAKLLGEAERIEELNRQAEQEEYDEQEAEAEQEDNER